MMWNTRREPSLPPRGAWIEIEGYDPDYAAMRGRSPHGERGLKLDGGYIRIEDGGRSPHGERGLKSFWSLYRAFSI